MIMVPTPSTITDIESLNSDMRATAATQPAAVVAKIQAMLLKRRYVSARRRHIRSKAITPAMTLSCFMREAFPAAIRPGPTAETLTEGFEASVAAMTSSTSEATLEFIPDSLEPYAEVMNPIPTPREKR